MRNTYRVPCVDRDSGRPYFVQIEAESAEQAASNAALGHMIPNPCTPELLAQPSPTIAEPLPISVQRDELAEIRSLLHQTVRLLTPDQARRNGVFFRAIGYEVGWGVFWGTLCSAILMSIALFIVGGMIQSSYESERARKAQEQIMEDFYRRNREGR